MRFYVPEWDDAVDAQYDFEHDELSTLSRTDRDLDYIWDIFDPESTPIDGVLISREQVEETNRKAERLSKYGVYDDPVLSIPEWLPTISDCGAWGYKALPFPPYGNQDMLDFYETLDVSVGVTIDHLVLGSGKDKGRLYLDKRAFTAEFKQGDLPDALTDVVDIMVDEWPSEWPAYVDEYNPSIRTGTTGVTPFDPELFKSDIDTVLERLAEDPRAVYREDDKQFRYDLTLRNAREMYDLYHDGDYPFRLMVAIQGWTPDSYIAAAEDVLEMGYEYVGIGGVAGSPIHEVRKIVKGVGKTITEYEREHTTRVDTHVFGFAKTNAFETIGRSGMTSFDSASMLRSAWTGGENYRLDHDERYDAIRVRYPSSRTDSTAEAVEKTLRGRETLIALRAYAEGRDIETAIETWHEDTEPVLDAAREYIQDHRHDAQFDEDSLRDIEAAFRADFDHARELHASFGGEFRRDIVRLLREDAAVDPLPFSEYDQLLTTAEAEFEHFPRAPYLLSGGLARPSTPEELPVYNDLDVEAYPDGFKDVWTIVADYAVSEEDEHLLEAYFETLRERPWERCSCPLCSEHGIEVCIFRGNDRNRRRGFHNTRRFHDEFEDDLPKLLVATDRTDGITEYEQVVEFLAESTGEFWGAVHDLPVAEVGVLESGFGVREWWAPTPISSASDQQYEELAHQAKRYQHLFLHSEDTEMDSRIREVVDAEDCTLHTFTDPSELRRAVLETCGRDYSVGVDFLPYAPTLEPDDGLDILVIDQCSGSKEAPDSAERFDAEETLAHSPGELIARDNVLGIPAKDLYRGRQQQFIKEAVRELEKQGHRVERHFISAGFGLVGADEELPPYDVTFSSMKVAEVRARSRELNIKADVQRLLSAAEYDLVFFALGSSYYTSIDIDEMVQEIPADKIGVVFNRDVVDGQFDNIVSVPARTEDAKRHGTIVIGLKGLYLKNFAHRLGDVSELTPADIEALCRRVDGPSQKPLQN